MIKITVIVEQSDHTGEYGSTRRGVYEADNPAYYGDEIRRIAGRMAEDIAARYDLLYGES